MCVAFPLLIQEMCELLFLSSFCGLAWSDSQSSNKCIRIAGVLFEKVIHMYFNFICTVIL